MYKLPDKIRELQLRKSNTLIYDKDTNLFFVWSANEAKNFARKISRILFKRVTTKEVAIIGAFISGDVVGVLPDGRILIFIHDNMSEILISELQCDEFSERLFLFDQAIENDVYEKVQPCEEEK